MPRFSLYLPDELYERARSELGDEFNWSAALREALQGHLECVHEVLMCKRCRRTVEAERCAPVAHLEGADDVAQSAPSPPSAPSPAPTVTPNGSPRPAPARA